MWLCMSPAVPTAWACSLLPDAFFASNIWPQLLSFPWISCLKLIPSSWQPELPPLSCSEMLCKLSHSSLPPCCCSAASAQGVLMQSRHGGASDPPGAVPEPRSPKAWLVTAKLPSPVSCRALSRVPPSLSTHPTPPCSFQGFFCLICEAQAPFYFHPS